MSSGYEDYRNKAIIVIIVIFMVRMISFDLDNFPIHTLLKNALLFYYE